MKSIREWMQERGMTSEEFDKNAFTRYFGSSTLEVDQRLRRELRPKVERIMDMEKYRSVPREELLGRLNSVVAQVLAEVGGRTFSSRSMAGKLSDGEGSDVDATKFSRMMGSEKMEVDYDLRRELKPKLDRIMDMEEYRSMPRSELQDKIVAVMAQLVSESSGGKLSLASVKNRIDDMAADPVAKESVIPSFLRWAEGDEAAVSAPQHKEGEASMDLKSVVEKRMMQLAMEIESDGKGSRQEVLAAMKAVVDSASKEGDKGLGDQPGDQPPQMDPQQASVNPQEMPAPQPAQA